MNALSLIDLSGMQPVRSGEILWSLSDIWNNARLLEIASALSTLILIFGAVLEDWPKLKQIALLIAKMILFRSTAFERCVLKKLIIHSVGAIMVVVGIAGELVFETRTFIVEDRETANLAETAGDAKQSALDAAAAAGNAVQSLVIVGAAAGELDKRLSTSSQKIAALEDTVAKAELEVEQLKGQLADRTLSDKQVEAIAGKLAKYAGQEYNVTAYWDSPESVGIANRVHLALQKAHWKFLPMTAWRGLMGGLVGIKIAVHPNADDPTLKAAQDLALALQAQGLEAKEEMENPKDAKSNTISLSVGSKR